MFYDSVEWYCDECNAHLNNQIGFTTESGEWLCSRCGHLNDVTDNNILSDFEMLFHNQKKCPNCGGNLAKFGALGIYSPSDWQCETCGAIYDDLDD